MALSTKTSQLLMIMNSALSANLFAFAARSDTPWDDEEAPPNSSSITEMDFNEEIIFLKRLDMPMLRFLINREDWTAKSYLINDFVITEDFKIYRCALSGTSTTKPTHENGISTPSGGTSSWEFIDVLSSTDVLMYLTPGLMPLTIKDEKYFISLDLVKRVRIVVQFTSSEQGFLPFNRQYRVAGLYTNPWSRAERTDTYSIQDSVKDYGVPITWNTLKPHNRTEEQIDIHIIDFVLPS